MKDYLLQRARDFFDKFTSSVKSSSITTLKIASIITIFATIIALFQQIGVWNLIIGWVSLTYTVILLILTSTPWGPPNYVWFLLVFILLYLLTKIIWQAKSLSVVAGEFSDNFKQGLHKWSFDKEGWKIEFENGNPILSVSESQDGGITKKGFNWSDYEFSCDTKVIKKACGWIIRAENRTKYFMLQINFEDESSPRIRPHFRLPDQEVPWIAVDNDSVNLNSLKLTMPIKLMEWFKVKIIANGGEVDLFLNGEHVFHYSLQDPYALSQEKEVVTKIGEKAQKVESLKILDALFWSYTAGRVGFRCAPGGEHAHFRNVKVKPL